MQHKNSPPKKAPLVTAQRLANHADLLKAARQACDKFEGYAIIDERYAFVDITKYTVTKK